MSNEEEKVYTQADMDEVLAQFRKETELNNQLLWAVVQQAGGHVRIPYSIWLELNQPDRHLAMWDDPATYEMNVQIVDGKGHDD